MQIFDDFINEHPTWLVRPATQKYFALRVICKDGVHRGRVTNSENSFFP